VNYSGAAVQKPEGEEFSLYGPWGTGHYSVAHRTLSGGTPDSLVLSAFRDRGVSRADE
jgi:hypothetical protein